MRPWRGKQRRSSVVRVEGIRATLISSFFPTAGLPTFTTRACFADCAASAIQLGASASIKPSFVEQIAKHRAI